MPTWRSSRRLLALAAVFNAAFALANLTLAFQDGFLHLNRLTPRVTGREMGILALAAGLCTIAATLGEKGRVRMLALNGFAFAAFGVLSLTLPVNRPISFQPISLLFAAMALSIGILGLAQARAWRRRLAEQGAALTAGVAAIASAAMFLALGFRWIRLVQPYSFFLWMTAYFVFSALCLAALAARSRPAPMTQIP